MADPATEAAYSEVFEDAPDSRQAQTIHHIRANSSIMQLKKILGEWDVIQGSVGLTWLFDYADSSFLITQWLIEEKYVSSHAL